MERLPKFRYSSEVLKFKVKVYFGWKFIIKVYFGWFCVSLCRPFGPVLFLGLIPRLSAWSSPLFCSPPAPRTMSTATIVTIGIGTALTTMCWRRNRASVMPQASTPPTSRRRHHQTRVSSGRGNAGASQQGGWLRIRSATRLLAHVSPFAWPTRTPTLLLYEAPY